MGKTIVITQSNYAPWRGYFDLMRRADVFVLFDVVQFTKNDWRNRNLIKSPQGRQWLTVPVHQTTQAAIDETTISDARWASKHIKTLQQNYRRADGYEEASPWLFAELEGLAAERSLSRVNRRLLEACALWLGLSTRIVACDEVLDRATLIAAERTDRLIALCTALGGAEYLSGPSAQAYLDVDRMNAAGISVTWMSYPPYRAYPQPFGAFDGGLSIFDLILSAGRDGARYLAPEQGP